jgi:RNA polymerase sigma-70 factor (ECF subfamily)
MSREHEEFKELLERVRGGSEDAVRELLDRYGRHILTVIRQKLSYNLRSVYNSSDFLQDVWASFFRGKAAAVQRTFNDPGALMRFLERMAHNKVAEEARRRLGGKKYGLDRERSLDGSARVEAAGLTDNEPAPGDNVVAQDEWERLLEGRPVHHVRILEMLRQSYTHRQIAAELKLSEKTVTRLIQKLLSRCRP